jgi:acyl carrier protein
MNTIELNEEQQAARTILAELNNKDLSSEDIQNEMSINLDLGIDSLRFIRLILELETMAGRRIFDVEKIARIKTVEDLYQVVGES